MTFPALRQRIPATGSQGPGVPAFMPAQPLAGAGHPVIRARSNDPTAVPKQQNVFASIFEGLFGRGNPTPDLARDSQAAAGFSAGSVQPGMYGKQPFYNYHEGDLFTPGTQNFVFEPTTELTPLTTIWGNAFLRKPNVFPVYQPPQVYANYNKYINGIGGLIAGQYALQPLESVENPTLG